MAYLRSLSGWNRYPVKECLVLRPERYSELIPAGNPLIARGQGRSYGDAALNEKHTVILTDRVNRFLAFDENAGVLKAEAGVTIAEVLKVFVPRGLFPPVVPGTKYVSLGGCLAADVHGKNHHHNGTFSGCVREIELVLADGSYRRCSPSQNSDLFWATVGGMGLTGIITEVTLELRPIESAYVRVKYHRAKDLDTTLKLLEDQSRDDHYSVAWTDCLAKGSRLGRSVVMCGHHAVAAELPGSIMKPLLIKPRGQKNMPIDLPSGVLNPWSVKAFNFIYYWWQASKSASFIIDYDRYFFPLDSIGHWNRMYGKRGFVQYQCVFPSAQARQGLQILIEALVKSRRASFLTVLKRFGPEGSGLLSFPTAGYTLAIDLPLNDPTIFSFLDRLDEIVLKHNGRVYLAKDARLSADTFKAMYPRFPAWQRIKAAIDPNSRFSSDLSLRLNMGAHQCQGRS